MSSAGEGYAVLLSFSKGLVSFPIPPSFGNKYGLRNSKENGGRQLLVAISHGQEPGLEVDSGDLERSHLVSECSPLPLLPGPSGLGLLGPAPG